MSVGMCDLNHRLAGLGRIRWPQVGRESFRFKLLKWPYPATGTILWPAVQEMEASRGRECGAYCFDFAARGQQRAFPTKWQSNAIAGCWPTIGELFKNPRVTGCQGNALIMARYCNHSESAMPLPSMIAFMVPSGRMRPR